MAATIYFYTEDGQFICEGTYTNPPVAGLSFTLKGKKWEMVDIVEPKRYNEGTDVWKVVVRTG